MTVHWFPVDDAEEHDILNGHDCWCDPNLAREQREDAAASPQLMIHRQRSAGVLTWKREKVWTSAKT